MSLPLIPRATKYRFSWPGCQAVMARKDARSGLPSVGIPSLIPPGSPAVTLGIGPAPREPGCRSHSTCELPASSNSARCHATNNGPTLFLPSRRVRFANPLCVKRTPSRTCFCLGRRVCHHHKVLLGGDLERRRAVIPVSSSGVFVLARARNGVGRSGAAVAQRGGGGL